MIELINEKIKIIRKAIEDFVSTHYLTRIVQKDNKMDVEFYWDSEENKNKYGLYLNGLVDLQLEKARVMNESYSFSRMYKILS